MDEDPISLDLQMVITCIKWSPSGEVLAVVGSDVLSKVPSSMVQLYSHTGIHLRTLRVPGTKTRFLMLSCSFVFLTSKGQRRNRQRDNSVICDHGR